MTQVPHFHISSVSHTGPLATTPTKATMYFAAILTFAAILDEASSLSVNTTDFVAPTTILPFFPNPTPTFTLSFVSTAGTIPNPRSSGEKKCSEVSLPWPLKHGHSKQILYFVGVGHFRQTRFACLPYGDYF